jgi:hypothetical protein
MGTFSVFTACFQSYHKTYFQQQIQQKNKSETEKLFFSYTDFKALSWIEKDKEFEWNGTLFDVNKIEKTENGFFIYCEKDGLEEILISVLKSLKKDMEGSKVNFNVQPQFFQSFQLYTFDRQQVNLATSRVEVTNLYPPIYLRVPSPPPDTL